MLSLILDSQCSLPGAASSGTSFDLILVDPSGGTGHPKPTRTEGNHGLPPVLFPVGSCYCGVSHWGLPRLDLASLGLMPGAYVVQGGLFSLLTNCNRLLHLCDHCLESVCETACLFRRLTTSSDAACAPPSRRHSIRPSLSLQPSGHLLRSLLLGVRHA